MSGWTGSQQQSNNIQGESKSRAFSQEEGRSKVRLDFPTALTVPGWQFKMKLCPRPGTRSALADGAVTASVQAESSGQLRGRISRGCKGSFLFTAIDPSRSPLRTHRLQCVEPPLRGATCPGWLFIVICSVTHVSGAEPGFRNWWESALWICYIKTLCCSTSTFSSSAFYLSNCSAIWCCSISDQLCDPERDTELPVQRMGPKQRFCQGHGDRAKRLRVALTNMKQVFLDLKYFLYKVESNVCMDKISHCSGLRTNPCDFQIPQLKCCLQLHIMAQTSQLCNALNYFETIFSHPRSLLCILLKNTNMTIITGEQSFRRKYKWKTKYIQIICNISKGMINWVENALPPHL